jgi:hypothetical protein
MKEYFPFNLKVCFNSFMPQLSLRRLTEMAGMGKTKASRSSGVEPLA